MIGDRLINVIALMPDQPDQNKALLELVDTVLIPATSGPFVVRDRFRTAAGIRFSTVWAEFNERFFGKVEQPAAEFKLGKHKLLNIAPDGPIIAELGGESKAEGTLAAAFELIRRQGIGQAGILQTNGYANIFYVRDKKNELCAVRLGWNDDGWVIDAISVRDPLAWNGKHQIFCPVP